MTTTSTALEVRPGTGSVSGGAGAPVVPLALAATALGAALVALTVLAMGQKWDGLGNPDVARPLQNLGLIVGYAGVITLFVTAARRGAAGGVRVASLIFVIATWEVLGNQLVLQDLKQAWPGLGRMSNPLFFAPVSSILAAAWDLYGIPCLYGGTCQPDMWGALLGTSRGSGSLVNLGAGFVIASVLGVVLGLIMGRYRVTEWALDPYFNALYATPLVALIPLIILWFGLGDVAKVIIVFLLTFFSIWINTLVGVKNVSGSLVEVARAFVANERQIAVKIILPATVPYIMAGLRQGIGRALIGIVVAEFYTALVGVGALINVYGNAFRTPQMFVPILTLMALGVGLTELLKVAERRVAPWKETERAGGI